MQGTDTEASVTYQCVMSANANGLTIGGILNVAKRGHGPRAPHDSCDCGKRINGIAQLRPYHYKRLAKKDKSISRPYGGVLCGGCVKSRIIRAFLLEEIKTIKRAKQAARK